MKKVIIIHGYKSYPQDCWFPWLKKELVKRGLGVHVSRLPNPERPKMKGWVAAIKKIVGKPDEQTYLVGHSLGVIAILRYLETLSKAEKIGGVISVGGRVIKNPQRTATASFFQTPVRWNEIKKKSKKFTVIHSANDDVVPIINGKTFAKKLKAKLVIENKGHFTREEKVFKLPSVLKSILDISK